MTAPEAAYFPLRRSRMGGGIAVKCARGATIFTWRHQWQLSATRSKEPSHHPVSSRRPPAAASQPQSPSAAHRIGPSATSLLFCTFPFVKVSRRIRWFFHGAQTQGRGSIQRSRIPAPIRSGATRRSRGRPQADEGHHPEATQTSNAPISRTPIKAEVNSKPRIDCLQLLIAPRVAIWSSLKPMFRFGDAETGSTNDRDRFDT
jgi:hypothetical protein